MTIISLKKISTTRNLSSISPNTWDSCQNLANKIQETPRTSNILFGKKKKTEGLKICTKKKQPGPIIST